MRKKISSTRILSAKWGGSILAIAMAMGLTLATEEPASARSRSSAPSDPDEKPVPAAVMAKVETRSPHATNEADSPDEAAARAEDQETVETKSAMVEPVKISDQPKTESDTDGENSVGGSDGESDSKREEKPEKKKAHDELPPIELTEEMKKLAQDKVKLELEYALKVQTLKNELADLDLRRQRQEVEMKAAEVEQKVKQQELMLQTDQLKTETQAEIMKLTAQREQLQAGVELQKAQLEKELNAVRAETEKLRAEKEKLAAQAEVEKNAQEAELAQLQLERAKVAANLELAKLEQEAALTEIAGEKNLLEQQVAMLEQKVALTSAQAKSRIFDEKLADNALYRESLAETELFQKQVAARTAELESANLQSQIQQKMVENETLLMDREILRQERRDSYDEFVYAEIQYTTDPLEDGILKITDRRISLNGVISMATADHITSMIDYYNNKSPEFPIFIVIDSCPGGSVMAGYRILKSMEGSQAPVYVVVKSYAASMAATIATLAPRSFAYPNAIIHHHQMLYSSRGNMTQQKEMLGEMQAWWDRLATPVAAKMGISLEEFVERMYSKNTDGEWTEFGSEAQKLKWIDDVITEIQELGTTQRPAEDAPPAFPWFALAQDTDSKGENFVQLPRLDPFDAWYLHNPDAYYRY